MPETFVSSSHFLILKNDHRPIQLRTCISQSDMGFELRGAWGVKVSETIEAIKDQWKSMTSMAVMFVTTIFLESQSNQFGTFPKLERLEKKELRKQVTYFLN